MPKKLKELCVLVGIAVSLLLLASCWQKSPPPEERSAATEESPFSRGPSGPPVIGAPTTPIPR